MATAARVLGVRLQHLDVKPGHDFDALFAAAKKEDAECVLLVESPRAVANRVLIADLGIKYRLPMMSQYSASSFKPARCCHMARPSPIYSGVPPCTSTRS